MDADHLDHGALAGIQGLSCARPARRRATTTRSARARSISTRATSDTLYRIHGTNEPSEIGQAVSSGCIRMRDLDVIDLYSRVHIGTPVVVK